MSSRPTRLLLLDHLVTQVGPVEAGLEHLACNVHGEKLGRSWRGARLKLDLNTWHTVYVGRSRVEAGEMGSHECHDVTDAHTSCAPHIPTPGSWGCAAAPSHPPARGALPSLSGPSGAPGVGISVGVGIKCRANVKMHACSGTSFLMCPFPLPKPRVVPPPHPSLSACPAPCKSSPPRLTWGYLCLKMPSPL